LLERNEISVAFNLNYSNVYQFDMEGNSINDFEISSPMMEFRYGLLRGLTVEVYYRWTSVFGGELDRLIENFHRSFNLPDNQRPQYPRNSVHYNYRDYFDYSYGKTFLSPLVLSFLTGIGSDDSLSLKGRLAIGIPLASLSGFVSDKPFLSTGLILSIRQNWFSLELSGYLTFFKEPEWLDGAQLTPRISFTKTRLMLGRVITGFIYRSSPFDSGHVSHGAYQIYLGYRIGKRLEIILFEDLAPYDTTPDITLNIRIKLL
jgi:hypothetical protein